MVDTNFYEEVLKIKNLNVNKQIIFMLGRRGSSEILYCRGDR